MLTLSINIILRLGQPPFDMVPVLWEHDRLQELIVGLRLRPVSLMLLLQILLDLSLDDGRLH